jgi:hypothetical protein
MNTNEKTFTIKQVAEICERHEITVRRWLKSGILKMTKSKHFGRERQSVFQSDLIEFAPDLSEKIKAYK